MPEFGRRLEQNASWGSDHGHGAAVFVLGGGINGRRIHGNWPGLAPDAPDEAKKMIAAAAITGPPAGHHPPRPVGRLSL